MGQNKTPMEYLMDFFLNLLKVVYDTVKKIAVAVHEARQKKSEEDKKNEKIDVNKSKRMLRKRIPKEIEKQMSKDNMDITVEEYDKLSRSDKKKKVAEWNALTAEEKEKRREAFTKKQMPKLREAVNNYYKSQIEGKKEVSDLMPQDDMNITRATWNSYSKDQKKYYRSVWESRPEEEKKALREAFMKEQQPKIDEAMKKHAPDVYKKAATEMGEISLFANREQLVPKRVADQMAAEVYGADGRLQMILPVSQGEFEKMNGAQRRNLMNSWQKLKPEEQRARLTAFEQEAKINIQNAWQDYSKSTGDLITGPVQVYTLDAKAGLDAYDKQVEQKKMSEKERQKNELQDQKLDGKQSVEKEQQLEKPKEKEQENVTVGEAQSDEPAPTKDPNQQSFGGRRRENVQLNQQLNDQVNNLQQDKETDKNLFKAEEQLKKGAAQIEDDVKGKEIWQDEEEREKFREQVKKGAEERQKNNTAEHQQRLQEQKDMNNGSGVMDNNRPMMPSN